MDQPHAKVDELQLQLVKKQKATSVEARLGIYMNSKV
jgi:hypothetical protein